MEYQWITILSESKPAANVKCTTCQAENKIHNLKEVEVFICPKCQKILSKQQEAYSKINNKKINTAELLIPLLSTCTFYDTAYTVVGIAHKHEKGDSSAKWTEYVLADAPGNYAFLTLSFGHWTFLKERNCPANFLEKAVAPQFENDDGNTYRVYSAYYQVTESALGEFPYDVIDVKKRFSREYVSAPFIFTYEHYNGEKTYFQGSYVSPSQVKKAFPHHTFKSPAREGIGSCQPFYGKIDHNKFMKFSLLLFFISIFPYLFIVGNRTPRLLTSEKVVLVDSIQTQQVVSASFVLDGSDPSLLQINTHSSIENDWIEADITLVNEKTGEEKAFVSGLEYYHGYEDGESWSEGGVENTDYLNGIKPGKYHAEIKVFGSAKNTYRDIQIQIFKDYPTTWNYLLLLGVLGAITAILVYLGNRFENARFGTLNDE